VVARRGHPVVHAGVLRKGVVPCRCFVREFSLREAMVPCCGRWVVWVWVWVWMGFVRRAGLQHVRVCARERVRVFVCCVCVRA